jgi:hypothetical protein
MFCFAGGIPPSTGKLWKFLGSLWKSGGRKPSTRGGTSARAGSLWKFPGGLWKTGGRKFSTHGRKTAFTGSLWKTGGRKSSTHGGKTDFTTRKSLFLKIVGTSGERNTFTISDTTNALEGLETSNCFVHNLAKSRHSLALGHLKPQRSEL